MKPVANLSDDNRRVTMIDLLEGRNLFFRGTKISHARHVIFVKDVVEPLRFTQSGLDKDDSRSLARKCFDIFGEISDTTVIPPYRAGLTVDPNVLSGLFSSQLIEIDDPPGLHSLIKLN